MVDNLEKKSARLFNLQNKYWKLLEEHRVALGVTSDHDAMRLLLENVKIQPAKVRIQRVQTKKAVPA